MSQAGVTVESGSVRGRVMRARLASFLQRQGALAALVVVAVFAAIRYERFLSEENLTNVLRQNSMLGLVALGMTFVILTGGIDLSVGSLVAVAGVVAASLAGQGVLVALARRGRDPAGHRAEPGAGRGARAHASVRDQPRDRDAGVRGAGAARSARRDAGAVPGR